MPREVDKIHVECEAGILDSFNSIELVHDLLDVSSATLEIGDDGSWVELERLVAPGKPFKVFLNDRLQMTGRAEVNEVPGDAESGTVVQLVLRTRMADARYASADPKTRVQNTSVKDFILALYAPHGYTASDFVFTPATNVDLMTGKSAGGKAPFDLEPIKLEQAKVNPPETVFDAASKHLRRHRMLHWDGARGDILVGRPGTENEPIHRIISKRGAASDGNNLLSFRRIRDWSEVASETWVYGGTTGVKDVGRAALKGVSVDLDLAAVAADAGHFHRPVLIPSESAKTQALVDQQALRERLARARRKDAWEFSTDGWTFWNGQESIPWPIATTVDVDVDTVGGPHGRYLITRINRRLDADHGATTSGVICAVDLWEI